MDTTAAQTADTQGGTDVLRAKVAAIADRVRHDSQTSTTQHTDQPGVGQGSHTPAPHHQPGRPPVNERLDTMELMLREIRDSMMQPGGVPVHTGQVQPQGRSLDLPLPARARHGSSAASRLAHHSHPAMPGQAQPREESFRLPSPATDRVSAGRAATDYEADRPDHSDARRRHGSTASSSSLSMPHTADHKPDASRRPLAPRRGRTGTDRQLHSHPALCVWPAA